MIRSLFLFCLLFILQAGYAQKNKNKLPEVTAADFAPANYSIDSSAEAVILYDAGSAKYETDGDAWFRIVYNYRKRIRLLSKNSFHLATVQIPLFRSGEKQDYLSQFSACTYNMEQGKIVKTKIEKESLFKDRATDEVTVQKFTFPGIKEGCIIEYEYSITSPRPYYLRGWNFQDDYPVLHSEYAVKVPVLFDFVFLTNGYHVPQSVTAYSTENYSLMFRSSNLYSSNSELINYKATNVESRWSLDDLPAVKKDNFINSPKNYISKIEFQLKSINYPGYDPQPFMNTWPQTDSTLMTDEHFGADLTKYNADLDADLTKLIVTDSLQTARNIYYFVKNNFTCTEQESVYLSSSLRNAYRSKKGNVADINLVLTAMLLKAGLDANPVLLSTTGNGFAYDAYPLLDKFNYVVTRIMIAGREYLLDASQKKLGFNKLPPYCYNGNGHSIGKENRLVPLSANDLTDVENTTVRIYNDPESKSVKGIYRSVPGYPTSYDIRNEVSGGNTDEYFRKLKSRYPSDVTLSNNRIDSLEAEEKNVVISYDMGFNFTGDLIYFNPMQADAGGKNPFTAGDRDVPVEMSSAVDHTYKLSMALPDGYTTEEMPKSLRVKLGNGDGLYEYIIESNGNRITLTRRLQLNKAVFEPQQYYDLRDFFAYVEKKENESIVFKKIK